MKAYIDQHRDTYGVEPICKVLQIAPSCYRRHAAQLRDPALQCDRAKQDDELIPQVQRVWHTNMQVYGADKVWKQLNREGVAVARCTVERLMRQLGLRGVRRGKVVLTTVSNANAPCPLDRVNRHFKAQRPNQLWESDFTYVSTWQGWLYVAFVVDVFARRIVGWRVSSSMHTDFVLDALEQALFDRQPERYASLIHHSDRGSQGGFNRSSQHLQLGGIYGATSRMDGATDRERHAWQSLPGSSFGTTRCAVTAVWGSVHPIYLKGACRNRNHTPISLKPITWLEKVRVSGELGQVQLHNPVLRLPVEYAQLRKLVGRPLSMRDQLNLGALKLKILQSSYGLEAMNPNACVSVYSKKITVNIRKLCRCWLPIPVFPGFTPVPLLSADNWIKKRFTNE